MAIWFEYWRGRLAELPRGTFTVRRGKEYVRIFGENGGATFERRIDTEEGALLARQVSEYQVMKSEYDAAMNSFKMLYPRTIPESQGEIQRALPIPEVMTLAYYENPPDIKDPYEPQTPYVFEGIIMKSRFEVLAGDAFRELGLEFKYDVPIVTPQGNYFIDMIVPVPERGRCVGFEFCGKVDNFKYMNSNCTKKLAYLEVGLIPNHDVIFVYGGQNWMPPMREIKNAIIFGVENC